MEGRYTEEDDEDNQSSSSGTLTCSVPEVKPQNLQFISQALPNPEEGTFLSSCLNFGPLCSV